ncbi:MAG TPA: hypothetical protein VKV05_11905, partial [Terriglobales bacterium]|nr:hypothetical protein [Terriglobales bacterium]
TILRDYDKVARQCAQEKVDFPRYLLRLTELELLDRERRATERRIRQAGWQELLNRRPSDVDEILRIMFLAWAMGSPELASRFAEDAATSLQLLAETRRAEAHQVQRAITDPVVGEAVRWLRTAADAARLQAQAEALKQLGKQIKTRKNKRKA